MGCETEYSSETAKAKSQAACTRTRRLHMVPSFHRDLVDGVATYAAELHEQAPDLDVVRAMSASTTPR